MPRALYTDWKNVYKRKATPAEQLGGKVPVTQFGRMGQKLGIRILAASSPQAKGRVDGSTACLKIVCSRSCGGRKSLVTRPRTSI